MKIKNQKLLQWGIYTAAGVLVAVCASRNRARAMRDDLDNSAGVHRIRRVELTVKVVE